MVDDFRSTDLAGAAYYAGIFGALETDPEEIDHPTRLEAETDEAECGEPKSDPSTDFYA